jgi:hypothetical protein
MHPLVVHYKKAKYDVYCARPSKWGNPYIIGVHGNRSEVIAKYKHWLLNNPDLMIQLSELKGKILGCWCAPLPCHCDVLAELANAVDWNEIC